MSRRQILTDEVNGDPLGRGYAGMTDQQVADDLNLKYRDVNFPVPVADLEKATRESLKWAEYRERQEARDQGTGAFLNPNMSEFMDIYFTTSGSEQAIDLQGDYMDGLIDRMVAEGSLGQGAADLLRNYGVQTISRGEEIGAPNPTAAEIAEIRS